MVDSGIRTQKSDYQVPDRLLPVRGFDFLRTQKFLTNSLHFLVKLSLKILHFLAKIYKIIIRIIKNIPDYLKTVRECAEEWGISKRRVQIYCAEGRIERAFKYGQYWLIPKDTQKPPEKEKALDLFLNNPPKEFYGKKVN